MTLPLLFIRISDCKHHALTTSNQAFVRSTISSCSISAKAPIREDVSMLSVRLRKLIPRSRSSPTREIRCFMLRPRRSSFQTPACHLFEGALKRVLIPVGLSLSRLIYLQIFVHILHKQERFVAGLYSGHLLIPLHSQSALWISRLKAQIMPCRPETAII